MKRVNRSFTSPIEEKILQTIVPLVPQQISPDTLTYAAVLSSLIGGIFYIFYGHYSFVLLGVNFMLFVNWLTDSTDGKVAMYRKISRPKYGFYIDHLFDSISVVFLIGGLILSNTTLTPSWLFALALMLIVNINAYLKVYVFNVFSLSLSRVSPTDARIVLVMVNLLIFIIGNKIITLFGNRFTLFDLIGFIFVIGTLILLIPDIVKTARILKMKENKK